jgi:threonine/homoserine/homoserine lactone efflux protein
MGELIKLIVDLLVLRDSAKKGMFSGFAMFVGFAVTFLVFALALGVISYADKHPGPTSDKLLIGFLVFAVLTFITTVIWGWRYQKRLAAARAALSAKPAVTTRT